LSHGSLLILRQELRQKARDFAVDLIATLRDVSTNKTVVTLAPPHPVYQYIKGKRKAFSARAAYSLLLTKLGTFVDEVGTPIIIGPVMVRSGNKNYLDVVGILPHAAPVTLARKVVEIEDKISGSFSVGKFRVDGAEICAAVGDDMSYPEISRACALLGADVIMFFVPPLITPYSPKETERLASVRSHENGVPVIVIGGYADEFIAQPTIITSSEGEVLESRMDASRFMLEVTIKRLGRSSNERLAKRYINMLKKSKELIRIKKKKVGP